MIKSVYTIIVLVFFNISMLTLQAQPPGLRDITSRVTSPSGYECKDGRIDLIFNNGIPPYSVEWFRFIGNGQWESVASYEGVTGQDDQGDLEEVEPGRYRAVVTDDLCGSGTMRFLLSPGENLIDLVNIMNSSYCSDKEGETVCDGQISVSFNINVPFEFNWSGPDGFTAQTETITNLCGGTYEVEVTTELGCTFSEKFTICCCEIVGEDDETRVRPGQLKTGETCNPEGNSTITINTSLIQSPSAETSNDGFIEVNIWGGNTATLALSWTGPNGYTSFSEDIYNLGVGTYCLDVTDGCAAEEVCFEMVDCSKTELKIESIVENTCGENYETINPFGSIQLLVDGDNPPFSYIWENGLRTSTIENLTTGDYKVTIYDSKGCSQEQSIFVGVSSFDSYNTTTPCGTVLLCNGDEVGFFPYPGELNCQYDNPFECREYNCYCPLTGLVTNSVLVPFRSINLYPSECSAYGECPNFGDGTQFITNGVFRSAYTVLAIEECSGCFGCYRQESCYIGGYLFILDETFDGPPSAECNRNCSSDCVFVCGLDEVVCAPPQFPVNCCGSGLEEDDQDGSRIKNALESMRTNTTVADRILWMVQQQDISIGDTILLPQEVELNTPSVVYNEIIRRAKKESIGISSKLVSIESLEQLQAFSFYSSEVVNDYVVILSEKDAKPGIITEKCAKIYPNPTASDNLNIEICTNKQDVTNIIITSSDGIIKLSVDFRDDGFEAQKKEVDISNLPKGFYFVKILFSDGSTEITKFIKQ